jgi:hypothetical protein
MVKKLSIVEEVKETEANNDHFSENSATRVIELAKNIQVSESQQKKSKKEGEIKKTGEENFFTGTNNTTA